MRLGELEEFGDFLRGPGVSLFDLDCFSSADALDVTVPNSFANSGIADANEINSNFEALKTAVDTFTSNAAAATAATDTAFSNGVASVDITSDNAAAYASGLASVDITSDYAAAEAAAASAACTQAGGTWEAGTSTCTAASTYNCFVAGFCAQAVMDFPPHIYGYTNVDCGHHPDSEPALGAGCNESAGADLWQFGQASYSSPYLPTSFAIVFGMVSSMCQ